MSAISKRSRTMWAGFVSNQYAQQRIDDQWSGKNIRVAMALFYTRKEARQQYQDVRKVTVREN